MKKMVITVISQCRQCKYFQLHEGKTFRATYCKYYNTYKKTSEYGIPLWCPLETYKKED